MKVWWIRGGFFDRSAPIVDAEVPCPKHGVSAADMCGPIGSGLGRASCPTRRYLRKRLLEIGPTGEPQEDDGRLFFTDEPDPVRRRTA